MTLKTGSQLAHYEILGPIGSGGMGEVYRARDIKLGRNVAIKILPDEVSADRDRLARFEKEARLASSLNHPNIITIYEIGEVEAIHYIAMEFVEGKTLRELLAVCSPLPMSEILELARQIASGLAKAHGAGIVHRDLKPENLMVSQDGFVKILDFGLGKFVPPVADPSELSTIQSGEWVTNPGAILGTVDYMSPEQAQGRDVDFRSDQFSFGSVLYELATGVRSFHRDSAVQTLSAIIEDEPEPISAHNAQVSQAWLRVVERCLAKDRTSRYPFTEDLALELSGLRTDSVVARRRPVLWIHPSHKLLWATGAVVLCIAAALLVISLVGSWPSLVQPVLVHLGVLAPLPERKNLVVLPFRMADAGGQSNAFLDGLGETLTDKLTRLTVSPSLQVVPATEVRGEGVDTPEKARREFGANLVLEGTLEPRGNRIRIRWILVSTATGRPLRSRTVTLDASDPSGIHNQVFDTAVEILDLEVRPPQRKTLAMQDTAVPAAKDHFLQGRGYLQQYDKPRNIDNAIEVLEQALALDSKYALAYAAVGEAYWRKYESTGQDRWFNRARDACERAIALNADLAGGHTCLGMLFTGTGKYEEAIREFRRALEIEPTSDDIYRQLALTYQKSGRGEEAEKLYRQAIASRPHYWANYSWLGAFYYGEGRHEEAAEMFSQVVTLVPDSFRGYSNLGGARLAQGRYTEAIEMLEKSAAIRPTFANYSNLATAYFYRRRFAEAIKAYREATRLNERNHEVWGNLGDAYYWAPGSRSQAAAAYRRAVSIAEEKLRVNSRDALLLSQMATYEAMLGNKEPAEALLRKALLLTPQDPWVRFGAALVYNQFQDVNQTLAWLEKAVASGFSITTLRDTPNFDNLWANSKFQALLRGR